MSHDIEVYEENPVTKAFQYYDQSLTSSLLTFYLSSEIVEPEHYVEMIHRIRNAGVHDLIYIILNTRGGQLDTGIQLINAMNASPATVTTVLDGECHSLGTLIFLSGDEFVINDHGLMMFHNFSGGVEGKGNEQAAQLGATIKWFAKLMKKIYYPFLSKDEIERLLRGEDIWMDSDETRTRCKRMIKILEADEMSTPRKKSTPKKKGTAKGK